MHTFFKNKTAIITGAARGTAQAIALKFDAQDAINWKPWLPSAKSAHSTISPMLSHLWSMKSPTGALTRTCAQMVGSSPGSGEIIG